MLLRDLTPDLLPPRATPLAGDVVLLTLPAGAALPPDLPPPYGTVAVEGPDGPQRIAAVSLPGDRCRAGGFGTLATLAGGDEELDDVLSELDLASRHRLLGFLLGFCRTAFGLAADPTFATACRRLVTRCGPAAGEINPVAVAGPGWTVVSGMAAPRNATLYVVGADGVRHSAAPPMGEEAGLQLLLPLRAGDTVVAMSDAPLFWTVRSVPASLPDVLGPAGNTLAPLRIACLRALDAVGSPAEQPVVFRLHHSVSALLRESQVLAPAAPRRHDDPASPLGAALEVALPDGEGGLFVRGWMRDPLHLIAGAELRTAAGNAAVDSGSLHRMRRPDLAGRFRRAAFADVEARPGFVAHLPDPSGGLSPQPVLALRLCSGATLEVVAPLRHLPPAAARDAILGCVPPGEVTPSMLDDCLAPAAAALHRRALLNRGTPTVVCIGPAPRRRAVSVIVPLYRNLGFIRFQAAAFAADAECRAAELLYVLDSPDQAAEVEHLLRGLHALHGLSFTLVVMERNTGYAAANNAAAAVARGAVLLLLNSDVVPARPGWLGPMRTALAAPGVGAVGPKLLFDDDSIQHAGLFFERDADGTWFNAHYHKGMPRHWPAANRRRRVPGVTGAALLVRAAAFAAAGGICEDYIIGDYEDSDFCLRLRAAGLAVAYVPDAELYHFERRSIRLHAGYVRSLAASYNRRLHNRRWDGAMAALMAHPAFRPASNGVRAA